MKQQLLEETLSRIAKKAGAGISAPTASKPEYLKDIRRICEDVGYDRFGDKINK